MTMIRKKPNRTQWLQILAALVLFVTASFSVTSVPMAHDIGPENGQMSAEPVHSHGMAVTGHDHAGEIAGNDDCIGSQQSTHGNMATGDCCWAMCMTMGLVEQTMPSRIHTVHQTHAAVFRQLIALIQNPHDRPPRNS